MFIDLNKYLNFECLKFFQLIFTVSQHWKSCQILIFKSSFIHAIKKYFFGNNNEMEFFLRILRSFFCVQYIQNKNKISNYTRLMDKLKNRAIFWKAGAVLNLIAANACNFVSERDLTRSKKQCRKSREN